MQGQYIAKKLPAYAWSGLSRGGRKEDEHRGVFYKKHHRRIEDSGNFWLSETPHFPSSSSWNMSLPAWSPGPPLKPSTVPPSAT